MSGIARICVCVFLCTSVLGLKVIFERARLTYFNPIYFTSVWANVTRYERKGEYYLNIELISKHGWGNNVSLTIKFYEYRWNTYKLSLVDLRYKFCDFLEKDPYTGVVMAPMFGGKCPVQPGKYSIVNVSIHGDNFPSVFPFEKGRANIYLNSTTTGEVMCSGEIYLSFRDNIKRKPGRGSRTTVP